MCLKPKRMHKRMTKAQATPSSALKLYRALPDEEKKEKATVVEQVDAVIKNIAKPGTNALARFQALATHEGQYWHSVFPATPEELLKLAGRPPLAWPTGLPRLPLADEPPEGEYAKDVRQLAGKAKWPELAVLFMPKTDTRYTLHVLTISMLAERILENEEKRRTSKATNIGLYAGAYFVTRWAKEWLA